LTGGKQYDTLHRGVQLTSDTDTRLIWIHHVEPDPAWCMDSHDHTHHELVVVHGGKLCVKFEDGQTVDAGAGDVLFYPVGEAHEETVDPDDPAEFYTVAFAWDLSGWDMNHNRPPRHVVDNQQRLRPLVRWLHEEWLSPEPHADLSRLRLFDAVISEWYRLSVQQEHPLVTKVRNFVARHIDGSISLDDLAEAVDMSKYHFVRTYKQLTGTTPMKDVRSLRVQYAQKLMLNTDLSAEEIAPRAGLRDKYKLTRLFRQHLDATPGELREARKYGRQNT
jgi:AraC-like DNA-binding protein